MTGSKHQAIRIIEVLWQKKMSKISLLRLGNIPAFVKNLASSSRSQTRSLKFKDPLMSACFAQQNF